MSREANAAIGREKEHYKDFFVTANHENWYSQSGDLFDWEGFQDWMGFSDEEIAVWKADPKRMMATPHLFSIGLTDKWMCFEVVKSHGCGNGHRVGDRLWWRAIGHLVTELSDGWCGHNLSYAGLMQDAAHNLIMQGKTGNELFPDHFSCVDTTCKYGWGYVECKVFIVDDKDLGNYFTEGYNKERYEAYRKRCAEVEARHNEAVKEGEGK